MRSEIHTVASPSDRGEDIKARQKLGGQHYWKENSHRHTTGPSKSTPPIQVDLKKGNIVLHLTVWVRLGLQGLFRGLDPHSPSHSIMEVEPWDQGDLVTEETHTSSGNNRHFQP